MRPVAGPSGRLYAVSVAGSPGEGRRQSTSLGKEINEIPKASV